ncbi:MAG: anthranilate synthase component I [Dehalococcoidia bacterium]|nr:anthranilate synthase component I [Dehalococcoidia bacterium]
MHTENITPDRKEFRRIAKPGSLVPVFREMAADLETPVSVFLKLTNGGKGSPGFLLESVEKGEQVGRYSFLGTHPSLLFRADRKTGIITRGGREETVSFDGKQDPLNVVKRLIGEHKVVNVAGLPRFFGGAVGYLAYDMVRFFERLPDASRDELNIPDCFFMFTDTLVIFDHVKQKMKVVCNTAVKGDADAAYDGALRHIHRVVASLEKSLPSEGSSRPEGKQSEPRYDGSLDYAPASSASPALTSAGEMSSNFTVEGFKGAVLTAKEHIAAGDAFQIVVSQRLRRPTTADPFSVYRALRTLNPSPYMFFLDFGGFQLVGSSPEMLVRLEGGSAETRPIAGTSPRGATDEEDRKLSASLLADPKERAEHVMLVDLGRNDLGRVCRFGSVHTPVYMAIEKYSHVIHIVSSVRGEIAPGQDSFSLLRACFPAGTLTGAPKVRAMEIINELEGLRRGHYGGAVGYFSYTGNMDTCITIRTILMKDGTAYLHGGAGIVADSDPETEYKESLKKIEVLGNALKVAEAQTAAAARPAPDPPGKGKSRPRRA